MKNRLAWARSGHEKEYCLNFEAYGHHEYIPTSLGHALASALPGFSVMNRGSRIEVMPPAEAYLDRDTSLLKEEVHQHVSFVVHLLFEEEHGPFPLEVNAVLPTPKVVKSCEVVGCAFTGSFIEVFRHGRAEHG